MAVVAEEKMVAMMICFIFLLHHGLLHHLQQANHKKCLLHSEPWGNAGTSELRCTCENINVG